MRATLALLTTVTRVEERTDGVKSIKFATSFRSKFDTSHPAKCQCPLTAQMIQEAKLSRRNP